MGRMHAARLVRDPRVEVVAVVDSDRAAREALGRMLPGDVRICPTYDELTSLGEAIDAAVICTPTTAHYEQILFCRSQGWAVLCEKPLADTQERMEALIALSESAPPVSLAYQRRSWATYRTLRREVQSGRWGAIQAVTAHNSERWQQTIAGTWRDDPVVNAGGFVGDAGSHKLDALFFVTGLELAEVFARGQKCGSRVDVVSTVSAVSTCEVPIAMDFIGSAQYQAEDLHVHCAEADLMIRDMRVWIARRHVVEPLGPLEPDSHPVATFLDLLDGTCENFAPLVCARPVWKATAAIAESVRLGQPVPV
jgi:predicted dehydrogenase